MVDTVGRLIQGRVSAGPVRDITQASALLQGVPAKGVVADKAYDAVALRESIRWREAVYLHSILVERFFCPIEHSGRIATRYDKLVERFASYHSSAASPPSCARRERQRALVMPPRFLPPTCHIQLDPRLERDGRRARLSSHQDCSLVENPVDH